MQNFIVLGIIPGTNIQTNLNFWLLVAVGLVGFILRLHILAGLERLQRYLVIRRIARTINHLDLISL